MAISYNIHIVHSREEVERQDISANIFSMSTYCLLQLFKLFATTLEKIFQQQHVYQTNSSYYPLYTRNILFITQSRTVNFKCTDFDHAQSKKKIICFFILVNMCTLVQCTLAHRYNYFLKHCYDLT